MALIDKASLLMVPSTYEAGKLYNVLPSGNRAPDNKGGAGYDQTRADFDFDRGSNAAASRINSSGLIEKYRENLLLQSNNFGTTWNVQNISVSSGQNGYDNTNDAWKLTPSTLNTYHRLTNTVSGAANLVVTLSIYAKADGYNFLRVTENATTGDYATFNLSDGSVSNSTSLHAKIESVGNGWYRCSSTIIPAASHRFDMYVMESASVQEPWSGDGTSGVLIQNAQLETGLVATDYLNSTSVTAKAGVLIDLPRINYDANGENGALLLEPSRQQLIQYSEYFGGWDLSNSTITNNATTSPEGVDNASLYTSSNATNYVKDIITAANGTYTLSAFFKRDATDNVRINLSDGVTGEIRYVFNLADETSTLTKSGGTISGYSADFENYGNGWYRLHITATTNAGTAITAYFETDNETGSFYLYGAMLEQNASYQSSYIPNHGTSGGVTRAADSCSVTGASDVIGQTEGTLFYDVNISRVVGNEALGGINSGAYANHVTIQRIGNTFQFVRNSATQSGATIVTSATISAGRYKLAIAYKSGDTACFLNGTQVSTTQTQTFTNASLSVVRMSGDAIGALPISDSYKQAILFKERLSNAELATLTTL